MSHHLEQIIEESLFAASLALGVRKIGDEVTQTVLKNGKMPVVRLRAADNSTVIAKRMSSEGAEFDAAVARELLFPHGIAHPRIFGLHANADGSTWLFMEDLGDHLYDRDDPRQREAVGLLLGSMGRATRNRRWPAWLCRFDLPYYREALDVSRSALAGLDDAFLAAEVARRLDSAADSWTGITTVLRNCPTVLCHVDFFPHNVCFRDGSEPIPIDWERCGIGPLAIDLGFDDPYPDDPMAAAVAGSLGDPNISGDAVEQWTVAGRILRAVWGVRWSVWEVTDGNRCIGRRDLQYFIDRLDADLSALCGSVTD